jgi:hypothetical protein
MDANSYPVDTLGYPVDQIRREGKLLTRVPAGGKGRSHKGASVALLGHHHLGENRFIKLNEITAGITQVD